MKIIGNEYRIKKDKDFIGQRFSTYTIEKIIKYENGETERRFKVFTPAIDWDINKVNLE